MDNPGGSPDKSADEQQRRRNRPQNAGSDGEKYDGGFSSVAPGEGNEDIIGGNNNGGGSNTAPPPPLPQNTAGGVVVTDPAASSSSGKKKRRTAIFDAPAIPGPCSICGNQYQSWRALFGHMKKHRKDRAWEGVFPPPAFTPPEGRSPERTGGQSSQGGGAAGVGQDLATTLLHLAEGIMARMTAEGTTDGAATVAGENAGKGREGAASSPSSPARGIGVDLNAAPEGTNIGVDLNAAPEGSDSPSSPVRRRDVRLDLNMPAPETDEDDDAAA